MNLSELQTRVLERAGENAGAPVFYTAADATAWINAANRLFVLLTLCLENSGSLSISNTTAFYSLMGTGTFSDWLLPLRVRIAGSGGIKLRPARLKELAALDYQWSARPGAAQRYALLGLDLFAVYMQQTATLTVTYACCPATLVSGTDTPAAPEEYHPALIDGAIPLMRTREGGQEWKKTLPMWDRFLDAATSLADYVRARNKEQGYDYFPMELRRIDRSKLLMRESQKKPGN
jgi:hypothetical protein